MNQGLLPNKWFIGYESRGQRRLYDASVQDSNNQYTNSFVLSRHSAAATTHTALGDVYFTPSTLSALNSKAKYGLVAKLTPLPHHVSRLKKSGAYLHSAIHLHSVLRYFTLTFRSILTLLLLLLLLFSFFSFFSFFFCRYSPWRTFASSLIKFSFT